MQLSSKALVANILIPVMLVTLISAGMSIHQLNRDTAITADILMSQVDHVTSIARRVTNTTAGMAGQPCDSILERLTALGAYTPYIRSAGIVRNDTLVCSSVTGAREQRASALYGPQILASTKNLRIYATEGLRYDPDHTIVIYAFRPDKDITAFSVVDARYFTDLMDSLDDENHAALQLKFIDGPVISGQEINRPHVTTFRSQFQSDFSQAQLTVQTPLSSLFHYILRNLFFLGPLSLMLTLAGVYIWRRWETRKMSLADEIRKGMAEGEFSVHYQPVCKTASGICTGAEALMRWHRKDGSTISPSVFIRVAEEEDIIISLTQHLFDLIASDVRNWQVDSPFHLGVNIAAAHLMDKTFTTDVLRLWVSLSTSFSLVLEVTERSLVEDTSMASEKLNELRQRGCQVAVDDFGTGYCSLNMLQSLPVDFLKIDKSFIDTLTSAGEDTPVLDTIIELSKRLSLTTIAEGIDTPHQAKWLAENDVPYAQGFLYARPMAASDFYHWYRERGEHSGRNDFV